MLLRLYNVMSLQDEIILQFILQNNFSSITEWTIISLQEPRSSLVSNCCLKSGQPWDCPRSFYKKIFNCGVKSMSPKIEQPKWLKYFPILEISRQVDCKYLEADSQTWQKVAIMTPFLEHSNFFGSHLNFFIGATKQTKWIWNCFSRSFKPSDVDWYLQGCVPQKSLESRRYFSIPLYFCQSLLGCNVCNG